MPSAKEVEQFAYCAHNWWLARHGATGDGEPARRGQAEHAKLGSEQSKAEVEKREYRSALTWSFRILAVAGSATFLTVELAFLQASPYHILLLATALVMVAASAGLLVIALLAQASYRGRQSKAGLIPGRLLDSDLAQQSPLLAETSWGLHGRPDYVLQTQGGATPVEVKTGHTPDHPHRSHTLQLACYLHLLEANGPAPAYGLLQYPAGVFRVDWTPALKADLKATLATMAQAQATGKADRDHEQPGRCRGCARRDACDQKLA